METMKAIVQHAPFDFRLERVPKPAAGPGEVVLRIAQPYILCPAAALEAGGVLTKVKQPTGGAGCDVYIECSGSPVSAETGVAALGRRGPSPGSRMVLMLPR